MGHLTALAPAKLNLGLRILRRRPDGYHDLLTVFQAVDMYDRLTVEPRARALTLTCTDPELPTGSGNLVLRAARALASAAGVRRGAAFHLDKRIPHGAGMGGGSADAAAALRLLVRIWDLRIGRLALARIAREIGADVPFFLVGGRAIGRGRGDRLRSLDPAPPRHFVVLHSPTRISAKWAYFQYKRRLTGLRTLHRMQASGSSDRWIGKFVNNPANDLEPAVMAEYPDLRQNLERLRVLGAKATAMTGSGSSVFGTFPDHSTALAAASRLKEQGSLVTLCQSIKQGVVILEHGLHLEMDRISETGAALENRPVPSGRKAGRADRRVR